ncbi:unnamed protein product [Protopolystoma xenopodis]|uniref:Uncharacterized protein n=1 Tax=Protopolystoma xenopodis TaxID=117903 RepID=A0A3S5CQ68_9PLAT|nr:unnamed protein product [Protopolystoma xenopodis]
MPPPEEKTLWRPELKRALKTGFMLMLWRPVEADMTDSTTPLLLGLPSGAWLRRNSIFDWLGVCILLFFPCLVRFIFELACSSLSLRKQLACTNGLLLFSNSLLLGSVASVEASSTAKISPLRNKSSLHSLDGQSGDGDSEV